MLGRTKFWFLAALFGLLPLILLMVVARPTAASGPWYVATSGSDANNCHTSLTPCGTINAAIGKSAPGDTINVAVGTYTIATGTQVVLITQSVSLLGGWNSGFTSQTGLSTVDGQGVRRGVVASALGPMTVDRFLIENGYVNEDFGGGAGLLNGGALTVGHSQFSHNSAAGEGYGGGILNLSSMTLTTSLVSGNSALGGGGVENRGQMTIISTTIAANQAGAPYSSGSFGGGGIENTYNLVLEASTVSGNIMLGSPETAGIRNDHALTVTNSTLTGNGADGNGDGITGSFNATQALYNTTISGNSGYGIAMQGGYTSLSNTLLSGNGRFDCENQLGYGGVFTSSGDNLVQSNEGCTLAAGDLVGSDGQLGLLQDNGGPALTLALLPGSPAINAGNPGGCFGPDGLLATDQRGFPRFGRCDIGAFERRPLDSFDKVVSLAITQPGQPLQYSLSISNPSASGLSNVAITDTLPAGLQYTNGSLTTTGGSASYANGVVTWGGTVPAGTTVSIQFGVTTSAMASIGTVITNTAIISGDGEMFGRSVTTTLELAKLYLPLAVKPLPGIQGYVRASTGFLPAVHLELWRSDGQNDVLQLSGGSDFTGFYNFTTAPSLPPGQFYYVLFRNTLGSPGWLSFWRTANLTSYTAGGSAPGGNFDIGDVFLVSPANNAVVALPALFQWVRRQAVPTDSYQLSVFDPNGTAFGQTAPLGFVSEGTVTSVPASFHAGTPYGWYVAINSPDGGYGASYYYRQITFNNILAPNQPAVPGGVVVSPAKPPVDRPRP